MNRTNTTEVTFFTLGPPDDTTFTFPPSSPNAPPRPIRIVIEPQGYWRMPLHWHPSEGHDTSTPCERVTCISGHLCVFTGRGGSGGGITIGSRGMTVELAPDQHVAWSRAPRKEEKARLTVDLVADHALWRNICSAVMDRNIFPELVSTPWWLKGLFALLTLLPSVRERLLDLMLWTQLQAMFVSYDFHVYHGRIPFTWLWIARPAGGDDPPAWAKQWQLQSMYLLSRVKMKTAYWTGRLFLGMKGEYAEYTPRRT